MPPLGRATAKANAKAKAKAKPRPRPQSKMRARRVQVARGNSRQKKRRESLASLNALSAEVGLAARPLILATVNGNAVEHRVRLLQHRCKSETLHRRLREAALMYTQSGGQFSVGVIEADADPPDEVSPLSKHKVLRGHFRIKSQAFMLTYHSSSFQEATWLEFSTFVKALVPCLGCRLWATCLEKGTTEDTKHKYHVHVYFYWTDGVGIDI